MAKRETNTQTFEELQAQIAELQARADEIFKAEKNDAVATVRSLIEKFSITAKEAGFEAAAAATGKQHKVRKPAEPKFKNPQTGETWSGRGRMPTWLVAAQNEGRNLDEFKLAA